MEQIFKRLGHLGEVHLIEKDGMKTFCGIRSDGPNFSEVGPVDLAPRPDPTLCIDCKEVYDERNPVEEKPKKAAPKKAPAKKAQAKETPAKVTAPKEEAELEKTEDANTDESPEASEE